ncbi:MAG: TPM domain-containing protein [Chthoniobacterales bacterium]|nr:TPM domain-containing protein [Chthoniobacterales bacterium]
MRTKDFMARLDHKRIVDAIAAAEKKTSGEIRVFVQRGEVADDPLPFAEKKFLELGMEKTAERNAVLILIAPRAQKFAVVGDEGIHKKCGAEFWEPLVATMRGHFQREEFTGALVEAIVTAGDVLAEHFSRASDDRNELSDEVVEG